MANLQQTAAKGGEVSASSMAIIAPFAGWLLPGLGHFIQRKWIRGLLLMLAVFIMFFAGIGMQGKVYGFNTGDLLDILGFVGDVGSGMLYFIARTMDWGGGNIQRAVADYGTKYIVVAGLLNIIAAVDAHQIAIGKKS
ncbi:MAG TPA: DUF6677 family protein [Candidatus Binatia bacterium]|jgi:hypothetical protein|nr:DUF6677 family protein [Candidatus Binatia bacterium]